MTKLTKAEKLKEFLGFCWDILKFAIVIGIVAYGMLIVYNKMFHVHGPDCDHGVPVEVSHEP